MHADAHMEEGHVCVHVHMNTHVHPVYTCTHTHTGAHSCVHTYTCMLTCVHTTPTCTHTHANTLIYTGNIPRVNTCPWPRPSRGHPGHTKSSLPSSRHSLSRAETRPQHAGTPGCTDALKGDRWPVTDTHVLSHPHQDCLPASVSIARAARRERAGHRGARRPQPPGRGSSRRPHSPAPPPSGHF